MIDHVDIKSCLVTQQKDGNPSIHDGGVSLEKSRLE